MMFLHLLRDSSQAIANYAQPRKTHDDYTIAWVVTTTSGVAAFRALLDEEHASLPQNDLDNNSYVLGRMGIHNVVLAHPGESKTESKTLGADILSNLTYSFPKIQLRLIVGVGGGAPQPINLDPKEDIRLGDVVVGFPNEENSKFDRFHRQDRCILMVR